MQSVTTTKAGHVDVTTSPNKRKIILTDSTSSKRLQISGPAPTTPQSFSNPLFGAAAIAHIKKSLASTSPQQFLAQFQAQNGLKLPHLPEIYQFFHIFGPNCHEIHQYLLARHTDTLMKKIQANQLPEIKLIGLLSASFSYFSLELLRPIIIQILLKLGNKIPLEYLKQLNSSPKLIPLLPAPVRAVIFQQFPDTAIQFLSRPIENYLAEAKNNRSFADFYGKTEPLSRKIRRENDINLQEIVENIANSALIYTNVMNYLRKEFSASGEINYCLLRVDLTLALHENNKTHSALNDSLYNLLQICSTVSNQAMESATVEKIFNFISTQKLNSSSLVDVAMILAHPIIKQALLHSILSNLSNIVENESIPNQSQLLHQQTLLLNLSVFAQELAINYSHDSNPTSKSVVLPTVEAEIFQEFYPLLCELVLVSLLGENEPLNDEIRKYLPAALPVEILLFYIIQRTHENDLDRVRLLLTAIQPQITVVLQQGNSLQQQTMLDFFHNLVNQCISMSNSFQTQPLWRQVVINQFFLPIVQQLKHRAVKQELQRLLDGLNGVYTAQQISSLMNSFE
jgi:hypothetical protein